MRGTLTPQATTFTNRFLLSGEEGEEARKIQILFWWLSWTLFPRKIFQN
jgi:hypothetical protein